MPYRNPKARKTYAREWFRKNKERLLPIRNLALKKSRLADPERFKKYQFRSRLRRVFDISPEVYQVLLSFQNGKCAICGLIPEGKRLAVDHNHDTGKIRGLLCSRCNRFLVPSTASPEILRRAAEYLEHGPRRD